VRGREFEGKRRAENVLKRALKGGGHRGLGLILKKKEESKSTFHGERDKTEGEDLKGHRPGEGEKVRPKRNLTSAPYGERGMYRA